MSDPFIIYLDRLVQGYQEKIELNEDPMSLDLDVEGVRFEAPVVVQGVAYLVDHELVLKLELEAEALIDCRICGESVAYPIHIPKFYHAEDVSGVGTRLFSIRDIVRDTLLLELPTTIECGEGSESCPERANLAKYLKSN